MSGAGLEFRRVSPDLVAGLGDLFGALRDGGDERFFHPHPLTADEAARLGAYAGRDLYYAAVDGGEVAAYAMLRGWDEGYAVPSLGIAVRPSARGTGLARAFMHFLHAAARRRAAPRVRLKVYRANAGALALYRSLGYVFDDDGGDELVGTVAL